MEAFHFRGLGTALITPFDSKGEVDYEALSRLLAIQKPGDVDYIVVLGTTGEKATLREEEQEKILRHIIDFYKGQMPLLYGLGGNNTAAICHQMRAFAQSSLKDSISGFLSVCPYYVKPTQEGLYQHFMALAAASPLPILLYNVPGRTGVNMLPETAMRIYRDSHGAIAGIKEASGNIEQIRTLIRMRDEYLSQTPTNPYFAIISGDDGLAAQLMHDGADGLISVASNAFPKEFHQIVHRADRTMQKRFEKMIELLFAEGNPAGIKTVLAQKGIIENAVRLPLVCNSQEVQKKIATEMAAI